MVPPRGLEPRTNGLKVRCSTVELEGRDRLKRWKKPSSDSGRNPVGEVIGWVSRGQWPIRTQRAARCSVSNLSHDRRFRQVDPYSCLTNDSVNRLS